MKKINAAKNNYTGFTVSFKLLFVIFFAAGILFILLSPKDNNFLDEDSKYAEMNDDYYGYLSINKKEGLPVVKGENNYFYLSHNIEKKDDFRGCAFLDTRSTNDKLIVHHHAAEDGYGGFSFLNNVYDEKKDVVEDIVFANKKYKLMFVIDYSGDNDEVYESNNYKELSQKYRLLYMDKDNFKEGNILILSTCNFMEKNGKVVYFYRQIER